MHEPCNSLPVHYSEQYVADYLDISLSTLRRLRSMGKLKSIKISGKPRITDTQLRDYMATLESEACQTDQKQ